MTKSETASATISRLDGDLSLGVLHRSKSTRSYELVGIRPWALSLDEDVDDHSVPEAVHEPQQEEEEADEVPDQRVGRGKGPPVLVSHGQHVLGRPVELGRTWRKT